MFSFFILLPFITHGTLVTPEPLYLHTAAWSLLQLLRDFPRKVCDSGHYNNLRQLDTER